MRVKGMIRKLYRIVKRERHFNATGRYTVPPPPNPVYYSIVIPESKCHVSPSRVSAAFKKLLLSLPAH